MWFVNSYAQKSSCLGFIFIDVVDVKCFVRPVHLTVLYCHCVPGLRRRCGRLFFVILICIARGVPQMQHRVRNSSENLSATCWLGCPDRRCTIHTEFIATRGDWNDQGCWFWNGQNWNYRAGTCCSKGSGPPPCLKYVCIIYIIYCISSREHEDLCRFGDHVGLVSEKLWIAVELSTQFVGLRFFYREPFWWCYIFSY